ncbi:MAG: PBP1A family penicillin-binding protein [Candidatus Syntrophosphaera sp.]|nr:PBP1A family penicillin-binding protein [Candidatus Syntrophosphaera sp.]
MKKKHKRITGKLLLWAGVAFCVLFGVFIGAFWFYQDDLPPTAELKNYTLSSGSEVYDKDGRMIYLFAFEKRKLVSLKELPPHLVDALLVTEDKRFYSHFGIDPISLARAFLVDIKHLGFSQGASTITQQMARNMFLTLDKKVSRKMREAILALRIESSFTKDEILEIYFNKIFWGVQNHGVETASLYYFDKHARDLSIPEAAMIVGMIQRPNYYDPNKHPERALGRRDYVLERLYKAGKISEAEYTAALATPVNSQQGSSYSRFASDYFIEHIRLYLEHKYGTEKLFEGGLKIYTTIDSELSSAADSIMNAYLTRNETNGRYPNRFSQVPKNSHDIDTKYIQGCLLMIDNKNGHVRAMIGGRSFAHSKYNRMTQAKRQPGSSIKPVYYTVAVEQGYTPATVINDAPISFGNWTPQNYNRSYNGLTRMRVALQWSYNVWAVKCAQDIGLNSLTDAFQRFGLKVRAENLTAALGSHEVTPIDMVTGFTAFPNGGMRVTPVFITRVEDAKGKILERNSTQKHKVCSPEVAYIMTSMLETVTNTGTGGGSRNGYIWPNAGKTGTSQNYNDSWFIGFNKAYTMGIWTGFDNSRTRAGTAHAASIWGPIMTRAIKLDNKGRTPAADDPRYSFSMPPKIVKQNINPRTGFSVSSGGIPEVFIEGTEPPAVGDSLQYNFSPTSYGYQDL